MSIVPAEGLAPPSNGDIHLAITLCQLAQAHPDLVNDEDIVERRGFAYDADDLMRQVIWLIGIARLPIKPWVKNVACPEEDRSDWLGDASMALDVMILLLEKHVREWPRDFQKKVAQTIARFQYLLRVTV